MALVASPTLVLAPLVSLAGLPLSTLLGAFTLFGLLTVGLYILKLRRRRLAVPYLDIFQSLLLDRKASALRSRLQRFLSLLLSLLLVAALVFALGDPKRDRPAEGRSLVVLLDVSASMAENDGERSRLESAKEEVRTWFESLQDGDELLLVEMGARPRPLEAFSSDAVVLQAALDSAEVLDVGADLSSALVFARDVLRGRKRGQIILVSDGGLPEFDVPEAEEAWPEMSFHRVGAQGVATGNLAVTAFSARRYPLSGDRFEVLLEVENTGEDAALAEISLHEAGDDGQPRTLIEIEKLSLQPGQRFSRTFENLAQADQGLIARIARADGKQDSFSRDDVARTLLAPRQPVRILVVGQSNHFLEAALLIEESFVVERIAAGSYPPEASFDVTIFDGVAPPRDKRGGAAIYLGLPKEDEHFPLAKKEELELFGFDSWKKDSSVFRLVDPYDVQVLKGYSFKSEEADVILGSSEGRPIFVGGEREEGRFLALGFSPRDSDLVLRAVWPLFVVNMIDELFPRGRGETLLGLRTGETWRPPVFVDEGVTSAEIIGPLTADGHAARRAVPIDDGRAVFFGQRAGFYRAVTKAGATRFSASLLSSQESSLPLKKELEWRGAPLSEVTGMEPAQREDLWYWLVFGVICVSFIEWWLYHRRWTV